MSSLKRYPVGIVLCPMGGHKMIPTAYLRNELVSEICSFYRLELNYRPCSLLYNLTEFIFENLILFFPLLLHLSFNCMFHWIQLELNENWRSPLCAIQIFSFHLNITSIYLIYCQSLPKIQKLNKKLLWACNKQNRHLCT